MQKRLVLTLLIALLISSFTIALYSVTEQHISFAGFLLLAFMVLPLNLVLPLSICGLIFYHQIRRVRKINLEMVIRITVRFVIICELICTLWAIAALLAFGHIRHFWHTYRREFATWNFVVLIVGILVPFLYYNRKFLRKLKRR